MPASSFCAASSRSSSASTGPTASWPSAIGDFEAILIGRARSSTADLIDRADRLRVIGRAGTGVDNVDIEAATKRGIIVANAPESNSVAAAEHTLAMALALHRNVPQAHGSLVAGQWERSRFGGNELYGKTLGVVGFGRIGQLVARRAQAFEMEVVAFDKFVAPERFRELEVGRRQQRGALRQGRRDHPAPAEDARPNWIDAEAIAAMRDGVRIVNCARGELIDLGALEAGLESGQVAGAALDVFPEEPFTDHSIFQRDDVVVTPHLGASTAEAQDRAGIDTAEQVRAALAGAVVTNAVNIHAPLPEALVPFVPLCERLGRLAQGLDQGRSAASRPSSRTHRRVRHPAAGDARRHSLGSHRGAGQPRQRAGDGRRARARARRDEGHRLRGLRRLVTVRIGTGGDAVARGTGIGPRNDPYLTSIWGARFYLPFDGHLAVFRYTDQPGMIGRVGTASASRGSTSSRRPSAPRPAATRP